MNKENNHFSNFEMTDFTNNLKEQDLQYARVSQRVKIIYWVLIPLYMMMIARHLAEKSPLMEIMGSICFLLAMLSFALIFSHFQKTYRNVDYSLPTVDMLKEAACRYKPFYPKRLWILVPVLLIDAGLSLNSSLGFDLLWIQVTFLSAVVIALGIGYMMWRTKYKPIRDTAHYLIQEIEENR